MPAAAEVLDAQDHLRQLGIRPCPSSRRRSGASACIARRSTSQRLVRAERVVPLDVDGQFPPHVAKPQGDDREGPDAFGLQGADEALDNRNAPVSADGPVPRPDAAASAPAAESATVELRAAIGDHVTRGLTDEAAVSIPNRRPLVVPRAIVRASGESSAAKTRARLPAVPGPRGRARTVTGRIGMVICGRTISAQGLRRSRSIVRSEASEDAVAETLS